MTSAPAHDEDACRERALNLLGRRAHSRLELRRKLRARGFADDVIRTVLDRLADVRLLDDQAFAGQFAAEKQEGSAWGMGRIRQELRRRGVDGDVIEQTLAAGDPDAQEAELARARDAAARFLKTRRAAARGRAPADPRAETAALYRFLARRGFSPDVCRQAAAAED